MIERQVHIQIGGVEKKAWGYLGISYDATGVVSEPYEFYGTLEEVLEQVCATVKANKLKLSELNSLEVQVHG